MLLNHCCVDWRDPIPTKQRNLMQFQTNCWEGIFELHWLLYSDFARWVLDHAICVRFPRFFMRRSQERLVRRIWPYVLAIFAQFIVRVFPCFRLRNNMMFSKSFWRTMDESVLWTATGSGEKAGWFHVCSERIFLAAHRYSLWGARRFVSIWLCRSSCCFWNCYLRSLLRFHAASALQMHCSHVAFSLAGFPNCSFTWSSCKPVPPCQSLFMPSLDF